MSNLNSPEGLDIFDSNSKLEAHIFQSDSQAESK